MEREDREDCDELQDKVDYAWNCTFQVRYDGLQDKVDYTSDDQSINHEDCIFDGQPFDDQPVDYDHGDEEYGGEESAGYNSY